MVVSQLAVLIVKVALHSEYYQLVRSTRVAHPSREVLCNTAEALTALTKFFYFAYSYRCCNRRLPVCMPTNLISELMREKEFYYKSVFVCCIIFTCPLTCAFLFTGCLKDPENGFKDDYLPNSYNIRL